MIDDEILWLERSREDHYHLASVDLILSDRHSDELLVALAVRQFLVAPNIVYSLFTRHCDLEVADIGSIEDVRPVLLVLLRRVVRASHMLLSSTKSSFSLSFGFFNSLVLVIVLPLLVIWLGKSNEYCLSAIIGQEAVVFPLVLVQHAVILAHRLLEDQRL